MKSYEKDLVYYFIRKDDYLEKVCHLYYEEYSPAQALDLTASYLKTQVECTFNQFMHDSSSVDLLLFYMDLVENLDFEKMAAFALDFYL